ncbi:MAG TPA: hypothetical protein VGU45_13160 [Microvirga sp.]|jgi:hypothetical protein|nr:hypothetical protein [Microvirga sp.]
MTHHDRPDEHAADAPEAASHLGQDDPNGGTGERHTPPSGTLRNPGGLSTGLQPGGTIPGKSPGASAGSIGTGGGSTAGAPTGTAKRGI